MTPGTRSTRARSVGIDPRPDDRVVGVGGIDDDVRALGPQRTGRSEIQAVEEAAEEQQQHDEQRQHDRRGDEAAGSATQLAQRQDHPTPPGIVARIGSMRSTRRIAPKDATIASTNTIAPVSASCCDVRVAPRLALLAASAPVVKSPPTAMPPAHNDHDLDDERTGERAGTDPDRPQQGQRARLLDGENQKEEPGDDRYDEEAQEHDCAQ